VLLSRSAPASFAPSRAGRAALARSNPDGVRYTSDAHGRPRCPPSKIDD
jgi:hypothetical protein